MPDRTDYSAVARQLRARLRSGAFLTLQRREITDVLREVSGEPTTRIKSQVAADLERALLDQGVRCYPSLITTQMTDNVRLFHAGSVLGEVVDLVAYPARETDKELGEVLLKVKGKWKWAGETGPVTSAAAL